MLTNFQKRVYNIVKKIPKGKVTTYKEVARVLGNPKLVRAVGNALRQNPFPFLSNFPRRSVLSPRQSALASSPRRSAFIPCHRVIKSDGSLGGYQLGIEKKKKLLRKEGVRFDKNGKIDKKYIKEVSP
jgi:methylated-DNA-[protein]-cysteine S-methyltransferase